MSFGTPTNPMPPGGAFIGSFISVNGQPLSYHYQMVGNVITGLETLMDRGPEQELEEAKKYSQSIVPVDTGYLRSTIYWEKLARYVFRFFASAKYARFVEEGTYRMRKRPYMFPAVARMRQRMPQVIISQIISFFR